jgi:hypothetical protein
LRGFADECVQRVGVDIIGQHGGDVAALTVRHNPVEERERLTRRSLTDHR